MSVPKKLMNPHDFPSLSLSDLGLDSRQPASQGPQDERPPTLQKEECPCPPGGDQLSLLRARLRLVDQLCAEQQLFWERGHLVPAEVYFETYPELANSEEGFGLVKGEILLRLRQGEVPAPREYKNRFPQFAAQLQEEAHTFLSEEGASFLLPSARKTARLQRVRDDTPRTLSDLWPDIPGYEIVEEVGRGGMGVVYKARQVGLKRLVALKMILGGSHSDPEFLTRFYNEAEAIARMQQPNIIQIFAVGAAECRMRPGFQQPYFSLEFVDGGDLSQSVGQSPQPPREAAALVETLARAVQYAHEQGIIHRDLKPGNILMTRDGQPKITDFGLAKFLTTDPESDALYMPTRKGMILGTPAYMAPEQAGGKKEITARTDVYALGVILYEMLAARCPFEGPSPTETLDLVRHQEPVPPRQLQPRVPRSLNTICLKCLEKEPGKRYDSAAALADDLGRFMEGVPILARPAGPGEKLCRWARRHPAIAGLSTLLLLTVIVSFVGMTSTLLYALAGWNEAQLRQKESEARRGLADQQRRRAEANEKEANKQRSRAEQKEKEAQTQKARAEAQERAARAAHAQAQQHLYFSRIAEARLLRLVPDIAASEQTLDLCLPAPVPAEREGPPLAGMLPAQTSIEGDAGVPPYPPGRRGWEWFHLKRLNHSDLFSCRWERLPAVNQVAFAPFGQYLAVTVGNPYDPVSPGEVVLADYQKGQLVWRAPHPCSVEHLAVSPDGRLLATVDRRGMITLLDRETGKVVYSIQVKGRDLPQLAFSFDSQRLFILSRHGRKGARRGRSPVQMVWLIHPDPRGLAVSPDGQQLALLGFRSVQIRDASTGKLVRAPFRLPRRCDGIVFSPDGKSLLLLQDRTPFLIDAATGKRVQEFRGHTSQVNAAAFCPDGRTVATTGADLTVRLWDVRTGQQQAQLLGLRGRGSSLAFHPEGYLLAAGSKQPGEVKIWDLTQRPEQATLSQRSHQFGRARPNALSFTPDSNKILVADNQGIWEALDPNTGRVSRTGQVGPVSDRLVPSRVLAFAPDGKHLAARNQLNPTQVCLWSLETGKVVRTFQHPVHIHHVVFSGDGKRLATCGMRPGNNNPVHEVHVWEVDTGLPLLIFRESVPANANLLFGVVALSPHGDTVAFDRYPTRSGKEEKATPFPIVVMDVATRQQKRLLIGHGAAIAALAFDPEGRRLASGDRADHIMVWDLQEKRSLYPHLMLVSGGLQGLAFHPGGKVLAAATRMRVHLWDVSLGKQLLTLEGAPPRPKDTGRNAYLAWSPDGQRLVANHWNGRISCWDTADASSPEAKWRLQREARMRSLVWHGERLEAAEPGSFAWQFHVQALLSRESDPEGQRTRAWYLAQASLWKEAARAYEQAQKHPSQDPDHHIAQALLHLALQDREGFARARRQLLERFGSSPNIPLLDEVCWLALTTPVPEAERAKVQEVGQRLASLEKAIHRRSHWPVDVLLACRSDQFQEALELLSKRTGVDPELAQITRALLLARTGQKQKAEELLNQFSQSDENRDLVDLAVPSRRRWTERIVMHQLRQEVIGLLTK
jgi:WD40 repeat protein